MSCKPVAIKDDVLNDLATRFLINIPDEDKDDPLKLCSHIEIAHWFYLDLIRPEDPSLPGCSMKEFMATIFNHCPFLVRDSVARDLDTLQSQWKSHKYRRPTRGAIILNQDLTKCLLVQGYPASTSWGFPKGKLERGERDDDCAIREVYEETGFDIRALIQSGHYLECQSRDSERTSRMYIVPGVPEKTVFKPRVRKEIRDIQWFKVEDLPRHKKDLTTRQNLGKNPSSFFMIIPFISQLKKWISETSASSRRSNSGKKPARTVSATFPTPAMPPVLQPQKRSSSSPSPSPSLSSHQLAQKTGPASSRSTAHPNSSGQLPHSLTPLSHTVQQSVPMRAVSGPAAGRVKMGPSNPLIGQPGYFRPPLVGVVRSHTIPHPGTIPINHRGGLLVTPPQNHAPHISTHPPVLWQVPSHQYHPSPPPRTHTSLPSHRHYVPRPTSAFNPVRPEYFNPKESPANNFNPFATLGVSSPAVPRSSKVATHAVASPYQWNGNAFRPVQLQLEPAHSWVRFKFDKPRILSAVYMMH